MAHRYRIVLACLLLMGLNANSEAGFSTGRLVKITVSGDTVIFTTMHPHLDKVGCHTNTDDQWQFSLETEKGKEFFRKLIASAAAHDHLSVKGFTCFGDRETPNSIDLDVTNPGV